MRYVLCSAVAAGRVVWYLARNPAVAMELMRCNLVPVLYHGLAKQDVADQLPLIGAWAQGSTMPNPLAAAALQQAPRSRALTNVSMLAAAGNGLLKCAYALLHGPFRRAVSPGNSEASRL